MRKLTNLGSALVIASLVAGGMVTFNAPIAASDFSAPSNATLCALLARAEAAAQTLPNSYFKTAVLAKIDAAQATYNCGS